MAKATITGVDRLQRKLSAMPREAKTQIRAALDKSADEMVALARGLAPVRDGDLRNSIQKQDGAHELAVNVVAGGRDAFYAHLAEAKTPFFNPAYRTLRKRIRGRTSRAINKVAKEAARK